MRKILLFVMLAAALIPGAGKGGLFAQRGGRAADTLEIKIASPLPKESPWGRTLDRIAAEWGRITRNQVRLRVLHGGTEGNEAKMRLSLASNTIQAAVFTSFGLSAINPDILTLSAPFLIRNEAELTEVLKEVQRELETDLNSGDFFLIAWSKSGFVNIFSKDPVMVPDDLRRQRIASNTEAAEMNTVFKTMGFQVVETDLVDMGTKLATGAIMAAYQNPAGVAAYQLHGQLKNMLSTNIAPIVGGIVMNQVTWRKIGSLSPRYQQDILRATRQIATELDNSMQKTVNDAVRAMSREGLKVNQPNAAQEQLWFNEIEKVIHTLMGTSYDRNLYQRITEILTRYRARR